MYTRCSYSNISASRFCFSHIRSHSCFRRPGILLLFLPLRTPAFSPIVCYNYFFRALPTLLYEEEREWIPLPYPAQAFRCWPVHKCSWLVAANWLWNRPVSIRQTSAQVGYNNHNQFTKVFRAREGGHPDTVSLGLPHRLEPAMNIASPGRSCGIRLF